MCTFLAYFLFTQKHTGPIIEKKNPCGTSHIRDDQSKTICFHSLTGVSLVLYTRIYTQKAVCDMTVKMFTGCVLTLFSP